MADIYRDVHLLITDEACISPLNYASPGVRLIQDSVSHQYAKIRAVVDLANGNNAGQEVELGVRLLDGQKVVAATETDTYSCRECSFAAGTYI